jgi:hypothetical protein
MSDPTTLQPGTYIVPPIPPAPLPVVIAKTIFAGLQTGRFDMLWGVGRSKPIDNPPVHGSIVQIPGAPATFDFHPTVIAGDSDNLYCLRRLIDQADPILLANAINFSNSAWVQIDNPANSQAFEFDYPTPLTKGTMGIQLLPGKPAWSIRAFDYGISTWRPLAGTQFDPALLKTGAVFGGEYTCDGEEVNHTAVLINGVKIKVSYSQACGPKIPPRLNAAFQMDATGDAKAYVVKLDKFTVTFA